MHPTLAEAIEILTGDLPDGLGIPYFGQPPTGVYEQPEQESDMERERR